MRNGSQNPGIRIKNKPMTPFVSRLKIAGIVVLLAQLCGAAFPQEQGQQDLGSNLQFPRTSQTKAGAGSKGSAAANPGTADGEGNLQKLARHRRPLYRLNRSDLVALSFTL